MGNRRNTEEISTILKVNYNTDMKNLIFSRKKVFAGSLLPYWIVVGISKVAFMQKYNFDGDLCEMSAGGIPMSRITVEELDKIGIRINSRQIKEISVADAINNLFVSTMDGCLSNEIYVDDCQKTNEGRITINTKGE